MYQSELPNVCQNPVRSGLPSAPRGMAFDEVPCAAATGMKAADAPVGAASVPLDARSAPTTTPRPIIPITTPVMTRFAIRPSITEAQNWYCTPPEISRPTPGVYTAVSTPLALKTADVAEM